MTDFTLQWVLPEPNRERAVDALGTSAVAGWIADQLVPNFSAQTERARYAATPPSTAGLADDVTTVRTALLHRAERGTRWRALLLPASQRRRG